MFERDVNTSVSDIIASALPETRINNNSNEYVYMINEMK